ncbi:inverse autotransporter beta domain-containing protein [Salmonella enterica]
MVFSKKPIAKYITWAIVASHISLPVIADNRSIVVANSDNEIQSWMAGTASSISPHLLKGTLEEYAKGKIEALPGQAANQLVNKGMKSAFPEIIFRGGVNLEDGAKYRSSEFDMFIPVRETTSSLLFGQLGFRDHDSSSFDGRTFVNVGVGYRQEVDGWLLGVNTFLDADIRYSHLRGGIGGEIYRDNLRFSGNYYFPLTGWKTSEAHEFHDERPAYGFDLRTKGTLPAFPWFSGELTYEQYYGDKVDLLGNGTLSRNPRAAGAALIWNPIPLLEVRAGYRDAGNGGSQAEGGLRVNYSFGTPLHEQLDYRNVGAPSNTTNRRTFVDRNYDIVMAYREQASKIRITATPVSGLSGALVTLMATVDSRYPIEKIEWSGDAELMAGLQLQGSLSSGLTLPQLPLTATDGQEYGLYLTVTDSRGTRVTSERIPVMVTQDEASFRSWINVINDDIQVEGGNFVISTPLPAGEEGKIIEWHYVRERSKEEWASLKPRNIKYQSDTPGLTFKSLGGAERDGHWVERVLVTHIGNDARSLKLHIAASGPDEKHPVKGVVLLQAQSGSIAQKVTSVEVLFTPGTDEVNGNITAPVVGTEMRARTLCINDTDCTDAFNYQWEISDEMKSWKSVPGATKATWLLPYSLNGESLQNKYIRVRIISDKENAESPNATSATN